MALLETSGDQNRRIRRMEHLRTCWAVIIPKRILYVYSFKESSKDLPKFFPSQMTSGYGLSRFRVTYIARIREELERTISNLRRTLDQSPKLSSSAVAVPQRHQRRAWRVWYNKAPHAIGWSKRHYVFHDWRYSFDFRSVADARYSIHYVSIPPLGEP